jgi:hypothetical protein
MLWIVIYIVASLYLKVRENGSSDFQIVLLKRLKLSMLKKAIMKAFNKKEEYCIKKIVLLPDKTLEASKDLISLSQKSELEVYFHQEDEECEKVCLKASSSQLELLAMWGEENSSPPPRDNGNNFKL